MSASPPSFAPVSLLVRREADVSLAWVSAANLAREMGFPVSAVYRLATAVSELGNNLVFHASQGGSIRLFPLFQDGRRGIEVVAVDDGPGIADLALALADGYSTNGGLGCGLPGCRRLVDEFEITSRPGEGTRVVTRLWQ